MPLAHGALEAVADAWVYIDRSGTAMAGSRAEALGSQQEMLGRQQEELGRQQEAMGREQEAMAERIASQLSALLDAAIADGTAEPVR